MYAEIIGYTSSLILLVTIGSQILKQWQSGTSKGVSIWLFIGQLTASVGFTVYSVLTRSTVFTITNAATAVTALIGLSIVLYHRHKNRSAPVGLMGPDLPRKYAV